MSRLLKIKEWLTLEEAAKYLSIGVGEEVTLPDILRFALDGHLVLSVNFVNHAQGQPVEMLPLGSSCSENEKLKASLKALMLKYPTNPNHDNYIYKQYRGFHSSTLSPKQGLFVPVGDMQRPVSVQGIWDLTMQGAEALDVVHQYHLLVDNLGVELVCLDGVLVTNPDRTLFFQILSQYTRQNGNKIEVCYYPAPSLPEDAVFVVRTAALREFEEQLRADDSGQDKPLHPRERKSVEQIIAVLAAMAKLDLSKPYKLDETLRAAAAVHGLELPNSSETVVKFLKAADEV